MVFAKPSIQVDRKLPQQWDIALIAAIASGSPGYKDPPASKSVRKNRRL